MDGGNANDTGGQDDISLSGISFPSLNLMYSHEENDIIAHDDTTSSAGTSTSNIVGDQIQNLPSDDTSSADESSSTNNDMNVTPRRVNPTNRTMEILGGQTTMHHSIHMIHNPTTDSKHDEYDDDGYPTDENTIHSFTQPKEKQVKRLSILQLARNRILSKKSSSEPKVLANNTAEPEVVVVDDESFLANVEATNVVDTSGDDTSFLGQAKVEDAPTADFDSASGKTNVADDSYYDVHADTLSRGTVSTKASFGDQLLKESKMAARMTRDPHDLAADNQSSASPYSYKRAFVDNVTLGSNFTSTCSALTDEYTYDARMIGMDEAIEKPNVSRKMVADDNIINRSYSGPACADTGDVVPQSDRSYEESLARPPQPYVSDQSPEAMTSYENSEHLARVVAFQGGDSEGYVDEEAAQKYAGGRSNHRGGLCVWYSSSSRFVKLIILSSVLLMFISVGSLALALLLPSEEPTNANGVSDIVHQNDESQVDIMMLIPFQDTRSPSPPKAESTIVPTYMPSNISEVKCISGATCYEEGSTCTDGSTESCCGETFDSFVCDCANVYDGKLQFMCRYTDACFAPSCETLDPSSISTTTPTLSPSKAPSSTIYATSAVSENPSMVPTSKPSTQTPTLVSSSEPTPKPSNEPTTRPTPIPTEFPIITKDPTTTPTTLSPTSKAPTLTQELVQSVTIQAAKDAYVDSTSPTTNYGTSRKLRVDGSPRRWSIIGFDMSSVINNIAQIQRQSSQPTTYKIIDVKLRMYTLDEGGGSIINVLPNAKEWAETSLTWNNLHLTIDRTGEFQVSSIDWVDGYQWYEMDVTDTTSEKINSVLTFLIKSGSSDGVEWASRERESFSGASLSPELVITFSSGANISQVSTQPTPAPESEWPTYYPTIRSTTTQSPSNEPTDKPTASSNAPTIWPSVTPIPTELPTIKPTRTRAPHKRPKPAPSSKSPTYYPTDTTFVKKEYDPQNSPTYHMFEPVGCDASHDINLATKQALMSQQGTHNIHVVFPTQETDGTDGSSVALVLDSSSKKVQLEFDLGLIAITSSIYNVLSVTLRLHVDSIDNDIMILIDRDESNDEEDLGRAFKVNSSDEGHWIDVDVTDMFDGSQVNKFFLAFENDKQSGRCAFASRNTCNTAKLVIVTES